MYSYISSTWKLEWYNLSAPVSGRGRPYTDRAAASACMRQTFFFFFPSSIRPSPPQRSLARSLSWAVATTGRSSPPPRPGAQVFAAPFAGEEHHLVRPPLGLPFLLRETVHNPNPNLVFVFGSDLVTSVYAYITATNFDCLAKKYVSPCFHRGDALRSR